MSDQDPERIVCFCHNVPAGRFLELIQSGVTTFEALSAETQCSTGCGGCEYDVREILEVELKRLGNTGAGNSG